AWIWWVNDPNKFSQKALKAIHAADQLGVSIFSAWEVAILVNKGRLAISLDLDDWIHSALSFEKIKPLEINIDILLQSTRLPGNLHSDPADRIIVATAKHHSCPLITKDSKLMEYPNVETIW
ncbi:MAG: type II toxin-antitoxin system VapC family toxin, partial [Deltaproteobacteria bacterium]|nr:type II toxin-antitoxin system VapC family toxin [Deltaproteobacteria bacterium]